MSIRSGSGRMGRDDGDRTFLWLTLGLALVIVVVGALAFLVGRAASNTAGTVAALGLPAPGAPRPTQAPASAPAAGTVQPTSSPVLAPAASYAPDTVWYFADGGGAAPFTTTYVLMNAGDVAVQGTATFVTESGPSREVTFTVRPQSRLTLPAASRSAQAVRLRADTPFFAERVALGAKDSMSSGALLPATTWYFPIVETRAGSDDQLLLANFNAVAATAGVTFMAENGITQTRQYTVPAMARASVSMTRDLAPLSSVQPGTPRGAIVKSDLPIVVEQTTYLNGNTAAYSVGGSSALARTWYLAEGNTRIGYDTTLAVFNPGANPAKVLVTYIPEGRTPLIKAYTLGPGAPLHLSVRSDMPDAALAMTVEADQPVVVERVMYLANGQAAHATMGATAPAKDWLLPEAGTTTPALAFLIMLNPGTAPADITVTLLGAAGKPLEKKVTLAAASRLALALDRDVPPAELSARVRSSQPVVVERVTYFAGAPGGMASMGIPR